MIPNVTVKQVEAIDELFHKFPQESQPQPVFVHLDIRTGVMWCAYTANIGNARTFDEHHRLVLTSRIPPLTAAAANRLMDEIVPLAAQVLAGAEVQWDGNNHIGVFTDNALAAWDALGEACDEEMFLLRDTVSWWEVSDWFSGGDESAVESTGLTADSTDQEIADVAAQEVLSASTSSSECGYAVLDAGDVVAYLGRLRAELRETVREELAEAAETMDAAERLRNELICQVKGWGDPADTLRSLGELAGGISHTEVGRIVKAGAAAAAPAEEAEEAGPQVPFTAADVDGLLPAGVHVRVLSDRDPYGIDVSVVLLWTDRPYSRCPSCNQSVVQDLAADPPAALNGMACAGGQVLATSQQHGCGEWLAVDWQDIPLEDATVDAIVAAAEALANTRTEEMAEIRGMVEEGLKATLAEAAARLREPLGPGETAEERLEEVCTGTEVKAGVCMDGGTLIAWDYDPCGGSEPITVSD